MRMGSISGEVIRGDCHRAEEQNGRPELFVEFLKVEDEDGDKDVWAAADIIDA
jgi:hypothetical protein